MPRVPRIYIENAVCYVTSRGDHDEVIFKEEGDYKMYLDLLKKSREQHRFKLFAFCLLPNHTHLLIEPGDDKVIPQVMHSLNSNYTKYFNGRHSRSGHLFQERYKMTLLEKDPFLANMTAYIHLNPKAFGLVSDAKDYPYSSLPAYLRYGQQADKSDTLALGLDQEIKEVSEYTGGKEYRDFILEIRPEALKNIDKEVSKKAIVGSEDFLEKVKLKVESEKQKQAEILRANILRSPFTKRFLIGGGVTILALGVLAGYLYIRSSAAKADYAKRIKTKDVEYRAGIDDYYKEMSKRLETEKQKAKYLEEKLTREADKK